MVCDFCVLFNKSLSTINYQYNRVSAMFSPRSFISLSFTFQLVILFKVIFVYGVK